MNYTIQEVLDKELYQIHIQVIVSHNEHFSVGLEAFVKGICPLTQSVISPIELFAKAQKEKLDFQLSIAVFEKSIKLFREILNKIPDAILYINMNECVFEDANNYGIFTQIANNFKVNTNSVAFDIGDTGSASVDKIIKFIEFQRNKGFYISIDDIGKTYFNLDRIIIFNPDMIKINHQYLQKLNNTTYTHMVLKYMSQLAHDMGMIVIETGLEDEQQLKQAVMQGAQFFQGYYIHKPVQLDCEDTLFDQIDACKLAVKKYSKPNTIKDNRQLLVKVIEFLSYIKNSEMQYTYAEKNGYLIYLFNQFECVENGWITDKKGIQITGVQINNKSFTKRNSKLFRIYDQGHDYSKDESFEKLMHNALSVWVTLPYISLLSNDICILVSTFIDINDADSDILYLVVNYEQFKKLKLKSKELIQLGNELYHF
jgi:EAL domain-containing protein (putative c-di-GMP-specific phosphodiesterase class I)